MPVRTLDKRTAFAFLTIVLFLGVNFVAVRFSNRELPPFWGGALRFIIASLVLLSVLKIQKLSPPTGRALAGAALFGALAFGANFGLLYWALLYVPSATAATIFAAIPLMTLLLAAALGQEQMRLRSIAGAVGAFSGIALIFADQLRFDIPVAALVATFLAAFVAALSGIVVRGFPRSHPVATNAVGMVVGATILLALSLLARETVVLPTLASTWIALAWLVTSSCVAFVLLVWVLSRWTASATSYTSVLTPLVTLVAASVLANESISPIFLVGTAVVLLGVYYGALTGSTDRR